MFEKKPQYPFHAADKSFLFLASLFTGLLVIANVLAVKPVSLGGGIVVPAAVLAYALTFPITDVVSEIWGKQRAQALVWAGFFTSLVVALLIHLAVSLPAASFWEANQAFTDVLSANMRIVLASMAAYLVSQLHDIWAFSYWKKKTGGKHLWLRNNASTVTSQFLDTSIFITLAFYGVWPAILPVIFAQFFVKVIIALLDTPLVYLLVAGLKRQ
jgi:uncharacterized integral membrane protein (TIGR00697 family)